MCWAKYRCIIPDIGPYACHELSRTWGRATRALYPPLGTQKGLKMAKNRQKISFFFENFDFFSMFCQNLDVSSRISVRVRVPSCFGLGGVPPVRSTPPLGTQKGLKIAKN